MALQSTSRSNNESVSSSFVEDAAFLSDIIDTQSDIAAVELDPPVIMRMVAARNQKLTGADGASVLLLDGDHIVCRAASGLMDPLIGYRFSMASSLSGHAVRAREALYSPDVQTDERVDQEVCRRAGTRSLVAAPMFYGGAVVGVLTVVSLRPGAFEPRHLVALRLMGGLVAAALHHSSEFEIKRHLLADRTRTMAALRESEERFRGSFEHAAIGMALVALDGRWMQVNRSLCDIVGYSEAELLVTDFQAITHPADLDADLKHVHRLIAGEARNYHMVKRYLHKRGHVVWILLSVSLVRDEAGKPLYFVSQIQDITERKLTEDALRISEEAYRTTFELAGVGMAHTDLGNGRFLRVNRKLCEITGYSAYELLCMSFYEITHPDDLAASQRGAKLMSRGEVDEYASEKRYIRKDGQVVWVSLTASILRNLEGRPVYAVAMLKDITDHKRAEWLERDRREVLELVAQDRPISDVLDRLAGLIERQTDASAAVLSLDGGQITLHAQNLPEAFAQAVRQRPVRLAAALADGASTGRHGIGVTDMSADPVWGELRPSFAAHGLKVCWAIPVRGSEQTALGVLAVFCRENREPAGNDAQMLQMAGKLATISIEHHQTTRQLAHLVRHDPLTGLPNRILFADRLEQALAASRRSGKTVALFVLDLDRFKSINDTMGHQTGDALLQQFAHRVRSLVRDTDTLARVGGDEFMLLLPELDSPEGAPRVAAAIIAALAEPFAVAGQHLRITSSIGIALCPRDGRESATLQSIADAAMYRAKGQGRNQFATGNAVSGVE